MADLPDVVPGIAWFRIGRDSADPDVSLVVSAFETLEKLDAYRVHPNHRPGQEALHESGAQILGMSDIETATILSARYAEREGLDVGLDPEQAT